MLSTNYEIALNLWDSFRDAVMFKQRFFLSHPVLDSLVEIARGREVMIDPGTIYYRARIIDDAVARNEQMLARCYSPGTTEDERKWYKNKANKFRGLTKEGSFVPPRPELVKDGRSNPKFIRYLYISESPTTAVFEVRPILYSAVNVAGIEVKEPLKIANLVGNIDLDSAKERSRDEWLLSFVQSAFSSPTNNPDDYIPSQIIAEFFRHLGYDGIRYSSSLHRGGFNLTIYDPSKCEPMFSSELRLENIKMYLRPAFGAENIDERFEYIVDNVPMRLDGKTHGLVEVEV